jgi:hypothetical protein
MAEHYAAIKPKMGCYHNQSFESSHGGNDVDSLLDDRRLDHRHEMSSAESTAHIVRVPGSALKVMILT